VKRKEGVRQDGRTKSNPGTAQKRRYQINLLARLKNFYAFMLGALFLAASCSGASGKFKIIEGGFFNQQGMYAEAIAAYRSSLTFPGAAPYGEYGLGVMYLTLDEGDAALERFTAAEKALAVLGGDEHRELLYRIHYNRGVIRFHNGDFTEAAGEFRKALEADSRRIEAKRNLELSLLSVNPRGGAAPAPLSGGSSAGERNEVFFDYLRQKEQDRWRSREWIEDAPLSGPDY
jgi:Ca-activated chloride channel family protein